ncbi:MAG: LytTR family transcriptional regulator [Mariniphaga sp.]|nr:LytTR family transcriptional regulator [Mariniphaga sp.]
MPGLKNKPYPFTDDLKLNLQSAGGISLGLFLFLLFFQPLDPPTDEFNRKLLILAGFGVIHLLLLAVCRIVIPSLLPGLFAPEKWTIKKEALLDLLFWILNSVAFSFYARYVGEIGINFHIAVNIVLISAASVAILVIINEYKFLKIKLQSFIAQNQDIDVIETDTDTLNGIEFESENQSERFFLFPEQIILIKSAGNYIEIIYKQNEKVSRRMIRNTLVNAEHLLSKYPFLIRCHRSSVININCIRKVDKTSEGLKLDLFDYSRAVNVSRQYVLKVKEALEQPQ